MIIGRWITGLVAVMLLGCSGGGQSGYDYAKIRKMANDSLENAEILTGHDKLILIPEALTGDTHRLIIYPEGVSSYRTAIFQLTLADSFGLEDGMAALRHGAGDYSGQKFVGIWKDGRLENVHPISPETVVPVSKPEISRDFVPELALLNLTQEKPFEGLIFSDPALKLYNRLANRSDSEKQGPISRELADLRRIFETTPLMQRHERRTDMGLGEQLLLMVWDDGYADPNLKDIDPRVQQVLMATNFADTPQMIKLPNTHQIRLHPGQTQGSDSQVRRTQIVLEGVIIPANTSAVLVRAQSAQ